MLSAVTCGEHVTVHRRPSRRPGHDPAQPLVGTGSCQESHAGYVMAGRLRVRMDDGREQEFRPGDAHVVSPGHDAWVVGEDPYVAVGFAATGSMAVGRACRCPCGV